MEDFKEFQGSTLDDCINQACAFFDLPREKLEIEIIQDAKTGIFGIVGARKAKIRAKRAFIAENVQTLLESAAERQGGRPLQKSASQAKPFAKPQRNPKNAQKPSRKNMPQETRKEAIRDAQEPAHKHNGFDNDNDFLEAADNFEFKSIEELDRDKLESAAREVVDRLLKPLAGKEMDLQVELGENQIRVIVPWEGDAGLLIGREGQTLAAIQYMASRILSKNMNAPLKVQVDIGNYRSRQEDKLCALARSLAEKALQHGRSFSTRPLSSYHRRIIHLCLQDNASIQTRSSGEGPLKRVLVFPRKNAGR